MSRPKSGPLGKPRYVPGYRKQLPPAPVEPPPLLKEFYRGFQIAGLGLCGLQAERNAVNRAWARKIVEAPNAAARAEVLAEERRLTVPSPLPVRRRRSCWTEDDVLS